MGSFFISLLLLSQTHASFYDHKAEGWHWYELRSKGSEIRNQNLPSSKESPLHRDKAKEKDKLKISSSASDPIIRLEAFKKKVERLKAIAVLNPTTQNVKAYMVIQKELLDRSTRFAQKWMEVVYQTPALDYSLHHPTSQVGRHVYLDQTRLSMEEKIRSLSKTHGLFFFYSGNCPYCKQFAPVVKAFADKYHWEVLSVSLDGEILPEFPNSRRDNGSYAALGITSVPVLLAVEPKRGKVIPLNSGLSTHDQIEDRVRVLLMQGGKL